MSVSDGERSQTGEAGMGCPAVTGRQLRLCWCPHSEAAPKSLGDIAGMGSHTGKPRCVGDVAGSRDRHGAELRVQWLGQAAADHLREQEKMTSVRFQEQLFAWG